MKTTWGTKLALLIMGLAVVVALTEVVRRNDFPGKAILSGLAIGGLAGLADWLKEPVRGSSLNALGGQLTSSIVLGLGFFWTFLIFTVLK